MILLRHNHCSRWQYNSFLARDGYRHSKAYNKLPRVALVGRMGNRAQQTLLIARGRISTVARQFNQRRCRLLAFPCSSSYGQNNILSWFHSSVSMAFPLALSKGRMEDWLWQTSSMWKAQVSPAQFTLNGLSAVLYLSMQEGIPAILFLLKAMIKHTCESHTHTIMKVKRKSVYLFSDKQMVPWVYYYSNVQRPQPRSGPLCARCCTDTL